MSTSGVNREPALAGQTVVVIGGSSGIGLETSRRARSEGADVVLTGRDPQRLDRAVRELGARNSAAFDGTDFERLERFFDELPAPIDHVLVSAGSPYYARLAGFVRAERSCSSVERAVVGRPRARSS
ncbi:MAG: SDR family NAD(P)-dependent oxidoreductase [Candidatus Acidiferrales bacterium]